MRVSRVAMSRIYAIYAKLTPNDAESCAERNQSHIFKTYDLDGFVFIKVFFI